MGRSYNDNFDSDEHDRRRVKKKLTKNKRNNDKAHLREMISGNINEEDYFDTEEDGNEHGRNTRV